MIFKKNLSEEDLNQLFTSDTACYKLLSDIKWGDKFECRKCGNANYCLGKTPYSRRCTRCKSDESATAGTIFHNCKFELHKAFYIAFTVCKNEDETSSYEFARKLALRQMTCWKFKDKIKRAIKSAGEKPENWFEIIK